MPNYSSIYIEILEWLNVKQNLLKLNDKQIKNYFDINCDSFNFLSYSLNFSCSLLALISRKLSNQVISKYLISWNFEMSQYI